LSPQPDARRARCPREEGYQVAVWAAPFHSIPLHSLAGTRVDCNCNCNCTALICAQRGGHEARSMPGRGQQHPRPPYSEYGPAWPEQPGMNPARPDWPAHTAWFRYASQAWTVRGVTTASKSTLPNVTPLLLGGQRSPIEQGWLLAALCRRSVTPKPGNRVQLPAVRKC